MKRYISIFFMFMLSVSLWFGISEYKKSIALYEIVKAQNAKLLMYEKSPNSVMNRDYNALRISVMRGEQFPIVNQKSWYKCVRVITE